MRLTPDNRIEGVYYDIFFCGKRLDCCMMADDEVGEVEVLIHDAESQPILHADRSPVTAVLRGPVEIRLAHSTALPLEALLFTPERHERFWAALRKIGGVAGARQTGALIMDIAQALADHPNLGALSRGDIIGALQALVP